MNVNLALKKKNGSLKSFSLNNAITVIGRRSDCDLRIPLMSVSKRHCRLSLDNETVKVCDLNSLNGTIVNGKPIDETVVKTGDRIKIGPIRFVLQIDGIPANIKDSGTQTDKSSQKNALDELSST